MVHAFDVVFFWGGGGRGGGFSANREEGGALRVLCYPRPPPLTSPTPGSWRCVGGNSSDFCLMTFFVEPRGSKGRDTAGACRRRKPKEGVKMG